MNKKELRSRYKTIRSQLTDDVVDTLSMDIANMMLKLPIWKKSFYHIFLSIKEQKEINTEFILHILQGKDKNVVIPKIYSANTLKHYLLTDSTKLSHNNWGIPEPINGIEIPITNIEVVFVPLLIFDKKGNRIGYGKGFYDRFLKKCTKKSIKIC